MMTGGMTYTMTGGKMTGMTMTGGKTMKKTCSIMRVGIRTIYSKKMVQAIRIVKFRGQRIKGRSIRYNPQTPLSSLLIP